MNVTFRLIGDLIKHTKERYISGDAPVLTGHVRKKKSHSFKCEDCSSSFTTKMMLTQHKEDCQLRSDYNIVNIKSENN